MRQILGLDIGGVIEKRGKFPPFLPVPDAFSSIKQLNKKPFEEIFIVSAVNNKLMENGIRLWLARQGFFKKTGISRKDVIFCRERCEKREICKEHVPHPTHFVDDRMEILSSLVGVVPNLYLFDPDQKEIKPYTAFLEYVHQVASWKELTKLLLQ